MKKKSDEEIAKELLDICGAFPTSEWAEDEFFERLIFEKYAELNDDYKARRFRPLFRALRTNALGYCNPFSFGPRCMWLRYNDSGGSWRTRQQGDWTVMRFESFDSLMWFLERVVHYRIWDPWEWFDVIQLGSQNRPPNNRFMRVVRVGKFKVCTACGWERRVGCRMIEVAMGCPDPKWNAENKSLSEEQACENPHCKYYRGFDEDVKTLGLDDPAIGIYESLGRELLDGED